MLHIPCTIKSRSISTKKIQTLTKLTINVKCLEHSITFNLSQ